jgi:phage shock protein A
MVDMNDFLKKLNVLVKASLNEKISGSGDTAKSPRVGKKLDEDVQTLRQRINEAVDYEDELQTRIRQFQDEAARWDLQADEAVTQGNDVNARYAIEQMQRAEQRAVIAQSDLEEHQRITQELIQRVNTLDAAVADASRARAETPPAQPESTEAAAPQQAQPEIEQPDDVQTNIRVPDLGNVLRDARDKITSMGESVAAQQETLSSDAPKSEPTVDDDLERRRERLSKR